MLASVESQRLLRVLVVDDDPLDNTATLLRLTGHEVETASSGPQAIATVATFRPQVTLLDLAMPGMDGYETARRIQRLVVPKPPVLVAVSGYADIQTTRQLAEAGFDLHLAKPLEISVLEELSLLVDEMGRLADRAKQQRERQQQATLVLARCSIEMGDVLLQVARTTRMDATRDRCISKVRRICDRLIFWVERHPHLEHLRDALEDLILRLPR